jgi:hypothetical protein
MKVTIGTSTDVEWAFSHGGLTVSKMQHSLSEESTRASTVLGSWVASFPELVPHDDILTLFKNKSKRMGKGKAKPADNDSSAIDIDIDNT